MRSAKRALRFLFLGMACFVSGSGVAQGDFPYDRELVMDVAPMRGSKRIPNLDIKPNGAVEIEMWCNKVDAQMVVAADTLTILAGQQTSRSCAPNQTQGDADLLQALSEVTNWRWQGDILVLLGPKPLRFRLATN
ncbi:META domain-containing protein [Leptospira sp. severe_002]|uniref:META domain-containing protein n=1 Tax=Leptospira sp. severe_002 TaxID=2838237 RepID=UPI001E60D6AB|nr:META domain-containing protein [Leptospira sp. severe_002]